MHFIIIFTVFLSTLFSYNIGDILLRYYYEKYNRLQFHRQRYVVKNFIKGIYLSIFTLYATSVVVKDGLWNGKWYNQAIHTLGILYCLPDLMGLIKVPKLHKNTIFHHVTVCILSTINMFNDYESADTIWVGIIIYAYLSSLTGIVNHYLAYRLICDEKNTQYKQYLLATAAYNIYASSLVINWTYQVYVVGRWLYKIFSTLTRNISFHTHTIENTIVQYRNSTLMLSETINVIVKTTINISSHIMIPTIVLFVYMGLLYFVIVDDIVLVKFLKKEMARLSKKSETDTLNNNEPQKSQNK